MFHIDQADLNRAAQLVLGFNDVDAAKKVVKLMCAEEMKAEKAELRRLENLTPEEKAARVERNKRAAEKRKATIERNRLEREETNRRRTNDAQADEMIAPQSDEIRASQSDERSEQDLREHSDSGKIVCSITKHRIFINDVYLLIY
jgi:hypothetical protein